MEEEGAGLQLPRIRTWTVSGTINLPLTETVYGRFLITHRNVFAIGATVARTSLRGRIPDLKLKVTGRQDLFGSFSWQGSWDTAAVTESHATCHLLIQTASQFSGVRMKVTLASHTQGTPVSHRALFILYSGATGHMELILRKWGRIEEEELYILSQGQSLYILFTLVSVIRREIPV